MNTDNIIIASGQVYKSTDDLLDTLAQLREIDSQLSSWATTSAKEFEHLVFQLDTVSNPMLHTVFDQAFGPDGARTRNALREALDGDLTDARRYINMAQMALRHAIRVRIHLAERDAQTKE